MDRIYAVKGVLDKGFTGQISYSVSLAKEYKNMKITLEFDKEKQRYRDEEINKDVIEAFRAECNGEYNIDAASDEEVKEMVKGNCKTEIHLSAFLNGEFIGCIHKQLASRTMSFGDIVSEGCLPVSKITGALKVTVLVFNVIKNETAYSLTVECE
ncbi:MAG: hypothetical protein K6E19_07625 [Lachnospiraceae bacterium]|nr:hypothetical protein [Lachnospiraceae bacterium]